ncbi:MAG: hypothetical protein Q9186_006121 [Xanthomendoza sp. 1 TL-2023]
MQALCLCPLSFKRRAPAPFLSFNSLNSFQAPKSNVSSPGSLWLSPPISSPSLMSPPPRHEAEDYLNSHTLHGGKKKHHARPGALSRFSESVGDTQVLQPFPVERLDEDANPKPALSTNKGSAVAAPGYAIKPKLSDAINQTEQGWPGWPPSPFVTTIADDQRRYDNTGRQPINLPDNFDESPAVESLRRLSQHGHHINNESAHTDKPWQPLRGMLESMFTSSDTGTSSSRKQSIEDQTAPQQGLRRRSTALHKGERRRPAENKTSTAIPGLEIPASITLRKATGLFQLGAGAASTNGTATADPLDDREESMRTPATCTLIGFDSTHSRDTHSARGSEEETTIRKSSIVPPHVFDLLASTSEQKRSGKPESRRQSLAGTAITVARILPSPAILASPTGDPSPTIELDRRISVVQVKSRKSLHQIIWREDDTPSSSSGTSSDSLGPTRSGSAPLVESSENSPVQRSTANSKANTRENSILSLYKDQHLSHDAVVEAPEHVPSEVAKSRPGVQMLQWSWGVAEDAPYDPMDSSDAAKSSHGPQGNPQGSKEDSSYTFSSSLPQLFVPDDDEAMMRHPSPGISRRASFVLDSSSLASMTLEREAGNRRSISITPLMLSRLGDGGTLDGRLGGPVGRRCPLRHPQPLTAADLHMQLEKEQEAVVNRLTRELSALRQQTASVASTSSSASTGIADSTDHNANHLMSGPSHPTPSRRHRSSSSLSTRSMNTTATTTSGFTGLSGSTVGTTGGVAGSTISGIAPARDTHPGNVYSMSRQNSTASSRRSQASSPSLSSSLLQGDHFPNLIPLRHASSTQPNPPSTHMLQQTMSPAASARSSYVPSNAAMARYEETTHHRSEMESVKRENEMLRRRIRELERRLGSRRTSSVSHVQSDTESTGASTRRPAAAGQGHGQGESLDFDDDAVHVRVGESAGSVGVGGGQ